MRILYVSPYAPARDGVASYTAALAAAVAAGGNEARVLVPRPAPASPDDVLGAVSWRPGRDTGLRRDIVGFCPDIAHVQFSVGAFGSRTPALVRQIDALRDDLGIPVVITMHEVTRDTAMLRTAGRALYRRLASRCDQVIVHTQAAKQALTGRIGVPADKVAVIPHPAASPPRCDVAPAELRSRFGLGDARVLLAFGFIHVDKGLPDLVSGLGRMCRSGDLPDAVRVVIAGAVRRRNGPMRAFEAWDHLHLHLALSLARRLGVRDRLVLTGYVPDSEIAGWFRAAEAVVLPYRRIEQSGVAGLAVALGVPVLASQAGGLDELFGGSPWTFPPRDPARLGQVVAEFLASPREAQYANQPIRQAADLPAVAAATLQAYVGLGRRGAGGPARVG
jgi:glycosyltransferase involved in cell wall biosynthesis